MNAVPTFTLVDGPSWISVSRDGVVTASPPEDIPPGQYSYTLKATLGSQSAQDTGIVTVEENEPMREGKPRRKLGISIPKPMIQVAREEALDLWRKLLRLVKLGVLAVAVTALLSLLTLLLGCSAPLDAPPEPPGGAITIHVGPAIATVSGDAKGDVALWGGVRHVVNHRRDDVVAGVRDLTGGEGVDRVIEADLAANLAETAAAHELLESGRADGKVAVMVDFRPRVR